MGAGGGSQILQGWECDGVITHCLLSTEFWAMSEKAMAPHSSTLAWKIPWMVELVGCTRDGVSREVPCSALKGETVPDSPHSRSLLLPGRER